MSFSTSSVPWKSIDGVSDQFPAGLRVLVVDDDTTCLRVLEKMLKKCLYEVTKCTRAEVALNLLRSNKNGFDVVLSDVHMPDMDGFKLLEHVGLEMDLPVIMMSADDSQKVVMKGVTHGACDYLIKPVRMEALKNVWQHVIRKKKRTERKEKELEQQSGSVEEGDRQQQPKPEDTIDYSSSANEGEGGSNNSSWRNCRKRKEDDDEGDDTSTLKKPRVVWSVELHQQFVTAVNQLGIDKAVPKKILELMNVPGLTRENVASHLQKYRLYLKRLSGQPHNGLGNAFICPTDPLFGPLNGLDFHALASSQLPPQSLPAIHSASLNRASTHRLLDQRNSFTFDQNPINHTHGRPASLLPSRHLAAALHQQQQPVQPFTRTQIPNQPVFSQARPTSIPRLNEVNNPHNQPYQTPNLVDFSRGTRAELPVNVNKRSATINNSSSFPLVGNAGISSSSYSMFDDVNGRRANEWALPGFDGPQQAGQVNVGPSVVVQPGSLSEVSTVVNRAAEVPSSSHYNSNVGLHITSMAAEDSFRFQNSPFSDEFGQEDLMSALLRQQQPGSTTADESDFCFEGYSLDDLPV